MDTGIGISEEKLERIKNILDFIEPDNVASNDTSEGFMLGIRILCQIMNYLNKS
jgi:hypothetical protein